MKNRACLFILIIISSFSFGQNETEPNQIDSCAIYIPNALVLSCDAHVPSFEMTVYSNCEFKCYQFIVYNKWAETIFESVDPKKIFNGTEHPGGVYIYSLVAKTVNDEEINERGNFFILK